MALLITQSLQKSRGTFHVSHEDDAECLPRACTHGKIIEILQGGSTHLSCRGFATPEPLGKECCVASKGAHAELVKDEARLTGESHGTRTITFVSSSDQHVCVVQVCPSQLWPRVHIERDVDGRHEVMFCLFPPGVRGRSYAEDAWYQKHPAAREDDTVFGDRSQHIIEGLGQC